MKSKLSQYKFLCNLNTFLDYLSKRSFHLWCAPCILFFTNCSCYSFSWRTAASVIHHLVFLPQAGFKPGTHDSLSTWIWRWWWLRPLGHHSRLWLTIIIITLSVHAIPNFYSVCLKDVKDRNTIDLKHSLETKEKFCLSRRQFHFSFKILEVVDNFNTVNIRKPNIWNTDTCCLPYVG